jgi:hypothetical protein
MLRCEADVLIYVCAAARGEDTGDMKAAVSGVAAVYVPL